MWPAHLPWNASAEVIEQAMKSKRQEAADRERAREELRVDREHMLHRLEAQKQVKMTAPNRHMVEELERRMHEKPLLDENSFGNIGRQTDEMQAAAIKDADEALTEMNEELEVTRPEEEARMQEVFKRGQLDPYAFEDMMSYIQHPIEGQTARMAASGGAFSMQLRRVPTHGWVHHSVRN